MTQRGGQFVLKILAAMLAVGMLLAMVPPTIGQDRPAHDYIQSGKCLLCHSNATEMKDHTDFLGMSPAIIWSQHDKHSQSFLLLKEKSRQLTNQILGFDLREAFADDDLTTLTEDKHLSAKVQTVKSCLSCHAAWPASAEQPAEPLSLGVSCQACHGPAGEWELPHSEKWWRRVSHEAKSRLGFTNVRDPLVKSELCASCHVGDVAGGKFVKHEWYAAGHPPLPGFELSTFASQMPVHWRPLPEKEDFAGRTEASKPVADDKARRTALRRRNIDIRDDDIRANYREANFPGLQEGTDPFANLPRTQEVVVSSAVVLKAYVKFAADYAEQAAAGKRAWPEFALYDCASCHHELRRREGLAERPVRRGPPGRPPPARWPSALLSLATKPNDELHGNLRGLDFAFTERPFGDPKRVAAAARTLTPQIDALCLKLRDWRFDDAIVEKALQTLSSPDGVSADIRDYATARQIAWAIRELRKDQERIPFGLDLPLTDEQQQAQQRIDALFHRDDQDELLLTLPAGQDRSVVNELPVFLRAMGEFDPNWFAERLKVVAAER